MTFVPAFPSWIPLLSTLLWLQFSSHLCHWPHHIEGNIRHSLAKLASTSFKKKKQIYFLIFHLQFTYNIMFILGVQQ